MNDANPVFYIFDAQENDPCRLWISMISVCSTFVQKEKKERIKSKLDAY